MSRLNFSVRRFSDRDCRPTAKLSSKGSKPWGVQASSTRDTAAFSDRTHAPVRRSLTQVKYVEGHAAAISPPIMEERYDSSIQRRR